MAPKISSEVFSFRSVLKKASRQRIPLHRGQAFCLRLTLSGTQPPRAHTDASQAQVALCTRGNWPVGLMDKASASGAGDSRFESWAGHFLFWRACWGLPHCEKTPSRARLLGAFPLRKDTIASLRTWAHGVVVSHPLSMREALGSIPSVSTSFKHGQRASDEHPAIRNAIIDMRRVRIELTTLGL